MRFQTDKESRGKTMNKLLKQVKTDMKNIPTTQENMVELLQISCKNASNFLFEYMLKCVDFSDEDSEAKEINLDNN